MSLRPDFIMRRQRSPPWKIIMDKTLDSWYPLPESDNEYITDEDEEYNEWQREILAKRIQNMETTMYYAERKLDEPSYISPGDLFEM